MGCISQTGLLVQRRTFFLTEAFGVGCRPEVMIENDVLRYGSSGWGSGNPKISMSGMAWMCHLPGKKNTSHTQRSIPLMRAGALNLNRLPCRSERFESL